jgi:Ca-activated chloride channel family protein
MNTEILENVANATGGLFLRGDNTSQVVETIADALIQMDKQEFETKQFAKFKDQYQWFLAIGLLLICFEVFLLKRKTKWIQKLNLFNEK